MNDLMFLSLILMFASFHHIARAKRQGDALFDLKQSLNDSRNQLLNWHRNNIEPCTWNAVYCDNNSNIIRVELNSMGFSGKLSPHVGELVYLQVLSLSDNNITGGIPEEFGNLTSLISLNLENNRLTGKISSSLGRLHNLRALYLSENNFDGSIPDALTNLSNLGDIRVAYNNLTGKIPDRLFQIPRYNFSGNKLDCDQGYQHSCASAFFSQGGSHISKPILTLGVVGVVAVFLAGLTFLLYIVRRTFCKNEAFANVPGEDDRMITLGQLKRFTWQELQMATDNFNEENVLGQGGSGKVYKGVLQGEKIAVKRLHDGLSPCFESSFLRELQMISIASHRNLLKLIGFCTTPSERLLVYPFMPNLSVAHHLRGLKPEEPILDWPTRKRVALGAAQGLSYLHEDCNPKIIHRDVKAANILLDENFDAVVGDFGLAKLVEVKKTSVSTLVRGTMGHIAPEYLATGRSSEKTDVFGYGVMLLELVTGQTAIRLEAEEDILLLDHVRRMEREKHLTSIVDCSLRGNYNAEEVETMIRVALLCTQASPEAWPRMPEVLQMLGVEGLAERWEGWQELEVARREELERLRMTLESGQNSLYLPEPMQLSGGR